jgi:hypothetical protein
MFDIYRYQTLNLNLCGAKSKSHTMKFSLEGFRKFMQYFTIYVIISVMKNYKLINSSKLLCKDNTLKGKLK